MPANIDMITKPPVKSKRSIKWNKYPTQNAIRYTQNINYYKFYKETHTHSWDSWALRVMKCLSISGFQCPTELIFTWLASSGSPRSRTGQTGKVERERERSPDWTCWSFVTFVGPVTGWVCSTSPMKGTVTYDCVPEVSTVLCRTVQYTLHYRWRPLPGSRLPYPALPLVPTWDSRGATEQSATAISETSATLLSPLPVSASHCSYYFSGWDLSDQ